MEVTERLVDDDDRSSPSQHYPQKAIKAQIAMAASIGCVRSRLLMRSWSIAIVTGHGGSLEEEGAMFLALLTIMHKCTPPFQVALWALCHALRLVNWFWMVLEERWPASEVAYAHSMNLSVGNCRLGGTCSRLQNLRK